MSRIKSIDETNASAETTELLEGLRKKLGRVPNIFKLMAHSPAALRGYIGLTDALAGSSLTLEIREKIALTVGQLNRCRYCIAAHTAISKKAGMADSDILAARRGESEDRKTAEILQFVRSCVENRGWVTDAQIDVLRAAGIVEQEIVEIILAISANMLTNYFNHVTDPEIDFPETPELV